MNHLAPRRAREILEQAAGRRVLVVGDLMLDVYLRGSASRISPEAPVPVVLVSEEWTALGGAANVAANAVALAGRSDVVGVTGRDAAAEALRSELEHSGIGASGIVPSGRPTTVKTRVMARHQQVARYDREGDGDVDPDTARALADAVERLAAEADAIVLEDYDKGVLAPLVIEAAMDAGRRRDIPVVVDPKSDHFFSFGGATLFKPNRSELASALRAPVRADDPEWMDATRRHLDCSHLLVTLGEGGMALMTEEGQFVRVPTVARSVFDVSGAGDTVTAVLALGLAAGASPAEAAILANHAAGVEVAKVGAATVTPEELIQAVEDHAADD